MHTSPEAVLAHARFARSNTLLTKSCSGDDGSCAKSSLRRLPQLYTMPTTADPSGIVLLAA